MKIASWAIAILLLALGMASLIESLTATLSVWLSIPMLVLSGAFITLAALLLMGLSGLYDLAIEVNGHRMDFRRGG